MKIMFHLDEGERPSNIGIAKALIETDMRRDELEEIVDYLMVYLNHSPILREERSHD